MRPLPSSTVFSRADLRALGWTDAAVSRAVAAGRLVRLRRGQFCRPGPVAEQALAVAAARARAGSVISHGSAALLHGLPVLGRRSHLPEITVPPNGTGSAHAAHLHRATLAPDEVVLVGGAPVTSVARTVIDLARAGSTACGVAAIDAALNRRLVTADDLDEVVRRCWNWPRIRRALRALRLADARAESALESVSRLVIGWLRLPVPDLQTVVADRFGRVIGRLDFYWDEFGVAGEADGRGKYDSREILTLEKERQEQLEDETLVVVRWGWDQPWRHPQLLKSRLVAGFERGLARDRSGLPRLWSVCPS